MMCEGGKALGLFEFTTQSVFLYSACQLFQHEPNYCSLNIPLLLVCLYLMSKLETEKNEAYLESSHRSSHSELQWRNFSRYTID